MYPKDQVEKIQKTASTLFDLRDHSDYKFCSEISDFLSEKYGITDESRISTDNFQALVVSRFATNHHLLELMAEKFGKDLQIIELGAGFTTHFLNLKGDIGKYIEIEFDFNSKVKEEITKKLSSKDNTYFIAGDVLSESVWQKVTTLIDTKKPVLVFCEGVIAHYFNPEQKSTIANYVKGLLLAEGSCFVVDDTLKNHPDLHSNPIIQEGMGKIVSVSGSSVYKQESASFDVELERWKKLFDNTIYTIDYVLSKPEMDFALKNFKSIVCVNDPKGSLESALLELSNKNQSIRVWK